MLSVKQGGIKYHFFSLWYDSTWDWTQVSRAIGEHSNRSDPKSRKFLEKIRMAFWQSIVSSEYEQGISVQYYRS